MRLVRHTRVSALLVVLGLCSVALADTLDSLAEARQLTDRVMTKVGEGATEDGMRLTQSYLTIPPPEFEAMLEKFKLRLPAMSRRFGKSIGHEFIREDKVGENLVRIIQVQRFERHAMRWSFYFYRGGSGWVLATFKTDDDIRQLFP